MFKSALVTTVMVMSWVLALAATMYILSGCGFELEHNIDIGIDDECLTCLPMCSPAGYACATADGVACLGCEVACVAGRDLVCDPDGPHCLQEAGDEDFTVPVLCVAR